MSAKDNKEMKEKKRPGRKPMTPEQKAAAKEAREAEKAMAANLKPEIFVEYQGGQTNMESLVEAAKIDFNAKNGKRRILVTKLDLYVVPEQGTAYYVINGEHKGQISF